MPQQCHFLFLWSAHAAVTPKLESQSAGSTHDLNSATMLSLYCSMCRLVIPHAHLLCRCVCLSLQAKVLWVVNAVETKWEKQLPSDVHEALEGARKKKGGLYATGEAAPEEDNTGKSRCRDA